jgi:hypothetical protein
MRNQVSWLVTSSITDFDYKFSQDITHKYGNPSKSCFHNKKFQQKIASGELCSLHYSLGLDIRNGFELWGKNEDLLKSCQFLAGTEVLHMDDASATIIEELWKRLQVRV